LKEKNYQKAEHQDSVRLDKWLWAARFFKTRAQAREAIDGGKVDVDGVRAKAAKAVKPGSRVSVTVGQERWEVDVLALADKRGPAAVARTLYQETQASAAARQRRSEERRLAALAVRHEQRRPDKHDRRKMQRFKRGEVNE
jgi:ribosome-associated heat shock protein Hsp15